VALDISSAALSIAGTTTYVRGLASSLAEQQWCELVAVSHRFRIGRHHRWLRKPETLFFEFIWLPFLLPRIASRKRSDIVHLPVPYAAPRFKVPMVVTIHDCCIFRRRKDFTPWMRLRYYRAIPRAVRSADAIIAVSDFTREEILNLFPDVSPDKIATVYSGLSPDVWTIGEENVEAVLREYGITPPFALMVGTIEPRKNIYGVIEALSLKSQLSRLRLVIAGSLGWGRVDVVGHAEKFGVADRVHVLGYAPREKLLQLYSAAEMLVYPSFCEGFGYPVLEAMARGCPVITSCCASLPEISGRAAILVPPDDPKAIADAMVRLHRDQKLREELRYRGREHASRFTWERACSSLETIYRRLVSGRT